MTNAEYTKYDGVCTSHNTWHSRVVIERNVPRLGRAVALRFLKWVSEHLDGVISLPTGKTPLYFIKYLQWYREQWGTVAVQAEREACDMACTVFPNTRDLTFVQMDEFLPIDPDHHTSFVRYIRHHYFPTLHLDESRALLMLPHKGQSLEEFCRWYEEEIHQRGGIGFFLGGIGPDGHVAFNMRGTDATRRTHVTTLNYESAAAAAVSFGGMQYVRDRQAITIGLHTIMQRDDATIIVMAAGEAKADVLARAVEGPVSSTCPASLLRRHEGTVFYVTRGAAKYVHHTKVQEKITRGCIPITHKTIVHTAPHHDDVMLSYYSLAQRLCAEKTNRNYFAYVTSGFNSVTHEYVQKLFDGVDQACIERHAGCIFAPTYHEAITQFCDAYTRGDREVMRAQEQCIGLHNLRVVWQCTTTQEMEERRRWLLDTYIPSCYPGQKDIPEVQQLKGMMRESECDCLWTLNSVPREQIWHMRASFYSGVHNKKAQSDENELAAYFDRVQPDVITVALDPEGTGPDTHFKTLVLVYEALKRTQRVRDDVEIWGYRNVWHRFDLDEATMVVPVMRHEMETMHEVFMNCFSTQRNAEFPPIYFDGPFSKYAQQIQREQWREVAQKHSISIPAEPADGCILFKQLTRDELACQIRQLGYE